eukprot:Selendium_serpulae@DN9663_c0_g1_i1.p1
MISSPYEKVELQTAQRAIHESFEGRCCLRDILKVTECFTGRRWAFSDVLAPQDLPRVRTSVVDGYAYNCSEVEKGSLQVLTKEKLSYVVTGGSIPDLATIVLPIEKCHDEDLIISTLHQYVLRGITNIREIGSDVHKGTRKKKKKKKKVLCVD